MRANDAKRCVTHCIDDVVFRDAAFRYEFDARFIEPTLDVLKVVPVPDGIQANKASGFASATRCKTGAKSGFASGTRRVCRTLPPAASNRRVR